MTTTHTRSALARVGLTAVLGLGALTLSSCRSEQAPTDPAPSSRDAVAEAARPEIRYYMIADT